MEGSESSVMRIGRSIWTVWGYLTGAVGRYLRPEVTNKENPNANSKEKDPVIKTINKSCRDLKEIEEEKERHETKTWNPHERQMREVAGLQCSGVKVQTATVQWEKVSVKQDAVGNGDHDEDSGTSKHLAVLPQCEKVSVKQDAVGNGDHDEDSGTSKHLAVLPQVSIGDQVESAEDVEKKAQELRHNEETLDYHLNINNKARNILITDQLKEDHKVSPGVFINADIDSQEFDVSGGKDPDLDMNVSGNIQDERIKSEKKRADDMMDCVADRTETMDSEDVEEEQINSCDNGDKEYTKEASVGNVIDQCEKVSVKQDAVGNGDHDEDSGTSKHLAVLPQVSIGDQVESAEDVEKKAQELRHNEETLDYHLNINNKARNILITDRLKEDHKVSPGVFINADIDSQEFDVSGGKDPDLDMNVSGNIQDERIKSEKKRADDMMDCVVDRTETMDSEDVEEEQINSCDNGDKEYTKEASTVAQANTLQYYHKWSIGDQVESAEDVEKKAQELRHNEETLDYHLILITRDERIKSEKKRADDMMDCVVDRTETMDSEDVEEEQINSCDNGDKEYTKEASVGNVIDQVNQDIKENSSDKQTHQGKACNENKTSESQMEDDLSQLIYPTSEGGNLLKIPIKKDIKEVIHKEEASTNKATVIPESGEINSVETEQGTLGKIKNGQHEEVLACVPQQLCEFTATEIFDKQQVYESKMHDAQTERTENKIEMQCEQTEFVAAQIEENSGINKKEIEPCSHMGLIKVTFADSSLDLATDLLRVTMESDPLETTQRGYRSKQTLKTEEASPKTEVMWLDDTEYISGSQRSEVVIKQGTESVIPRVQVEAGSQSKTEDPRSKCKQDIKAEVSSEDVMKSAIVEINLQEHSTNREEALQKTAYQYSHEQEPGQEKSANGILNEPELLKAPFYEMLGELRGTETNSAGQTDETSVKSTDQMSSPSLEELDKTQCSIELSVGSTTELIVETKTTSTEQKLLLIKQSEVAGTCKPATTELKCQQAESENDTSKTESESSVTTTEATSETCIMSTETEAPVLHMSKTLNLLRDQLIYSEGMAQDKSDKTESCGSNLGSSETSDLASPLQTLKMWRNAQKDDDDDDDEDDEDRTVETVPGLPDEVKAITTLGVLEEAMSGLTKERQSELSRQRVSPDNRITEIEGEKIELLNDTVDQRNDLQVETMDTGSGACGQNEVEKMAQYTRGEKEQMELTAKGKTNMPHKLASVSEVTIHTKKDHEEKNDYGESVIDNNENTRERNRPRLKRRFEKMEKEEKDKPSVRKDWAMADLFPLQVSSLDFTVQKSKIAVKNPLIRPPKDPRTLINMTSVEPLNPPCPPGPSLQRKSLAEGVSVMGKGVIGFKLPGLGSGLPVLRQTEAGRKMRDKEDAQCVTSQKFGMQTDPEDKCGKQDQMHDKPKSAPLRHPGMGSQQMMMELKNKLTKNKNAKE
ncbi:LOW QUALITY PROTEIN: uncharacterized protein si:ch211-136m16.8 [Electrophorus electricus]|uniref:LOW QUALITY PROTEIN: uncharacterized protein si:ch211-136m16.8 n=1 Tax=Electrophorus electricus TaxID=8005 RepID=UPI0015CFE3EA|nr:LOW QUALITY PROTEIN: uncharacterized protein si:ch211-136m16.8 [Electrophorus electricus]